MCNITGNTVAIHITSSPTDVHAEAALASSITSAAREVNNNKCEPIVQQLARQYRGTFDDDERSRLKCLIQEEYWKALKDVTPWKLLPEHVNMLTDSAVGGIRVDHAEFRHSILLYCEINTVEALNHLKWMIDSGELSRLFSRMLCDYADFEIVASASLSAQQYNMALKSIRGKANCYNNLFNVRNRND